MPDVVVVGAGIVGASVAYHVARRGAAVTLVDKGLPGSGVTSDSFAWIGNSGVVTGPVAALRQSSTDDYRRLEAELAGVRVRWTGSLSWGADWPSSEAELGPGQRLVDAGVIAELEPNLRQLPPQAVHASGDGAVDPVAVTEALVQGAREHGADVVLGTAVTSVRTRRGQVDGVDTSAGVLYAGTVVVAAGVDAPQLGASVGIEVPVAPSPCLLLRFDAQPRLIHTLLSSHEFEARQAGDGTLLAAADYTGEVTRGEVERTAQQTLRAITSAFRGAADVRLRSAHVGVRPMPSDDQPIIGTAVGLPGLYLTVMHAGVNLAPVVGRLVAGELVDGEVGTPLQGCRPPA